MKLATVLLIATMLQVSAASFAQKITFVKKNATYKQLFVEINRQTGYSVLLSGNRIKAGQQFNVNFKSAPLAEVLTSVFDKQLVEYTIEDKTIVIRDKKELLLNTAPVLAARDTAFVITGRVLDEKRMPMVGASVKLDQKNLLSATTISDSNGGFKLTANKGSRLTVTYVGYNTMMLTIKNGNIGDIKLVPTSNELQEVKVIIGYGTTTKMLNTGSVAVVTSNDIKNQPVPNVLQALQGQVPGLTVSQTSGFASASFNLKIRGQNTLSTSGYNVNKLSEPLYILDGVPIISSGTSSDLNVGINKNGLTGPTEGQSPLYGLNPTDIESISILKDADATAIYGARGANGVILITTKKGKVGPASVTANVYTGVSLQTRKLDLMNTQQYLAMRERAVSKR